MYPVSSSSKITAHVSPEESVCKSRCETIMIVLSIIATLVGIGLVTCYMLLSLPFADILLIIGLVCLSLVPIIFCCMICTRYLQSVSKVSIESKKLKT
ncbi:hypothetical protein [Chlamydia sp. 17-3921]|uniref:hypothetical protein n=1 Tax=Chlamydia sp. 17-3921 TaxID=2675798 RepID=UPI001918C1B1|nr:hypothetical protein [Chlamydia sp. 17-3921]